MLLRLILLRIQDILHLHLHTGAQAGKQWLQPGADCRVRVVRFWTFLVIHPCVLSILHRLQSGWCHRGFLWLHIWGRDCEQSVSPGYPMNKTSLHAHLLRFFSQQTPEKWTTLGQTPHGGPALWGLGVGQVRGGHHRHVQGGAVGRRGGGGGRRARGSRGHRGVGTMAG